MTDSKAFRAGFWGMLGVFAAWILLTAILFVILVIVGVHAGDLTAP